MSGSRRSLRNVQGGYIKYCKSDDSFEITLAVTRSFSVWRRATAPSVSFFSPALIFLALVKSRVYIYTHTHRIIPIVSAISTICWCMSYTVRLDVGVYFSWELSLPLFSLSLLRFFFLWIKFQHFFPTIFDYFDRRIPFRSWLHLWRRSNRSKWIRD